MRAETFRVNEGLNWFDLPKTSGSHDGEVLGESTGGLASRGGPHLFRTHIRFSPANFPTPESAVVLGNEGAGAVWRKRRRNGIFPSLTRECFFGRLMAL